MRAVFARAMASSLKTLASSLAFNLLTRTPMLRASTRYLAEMLPFGSSLPS